MHLVRLEMVQDAFIAPCLGQKMLQERKFRVKWLIFKISDKRVNIEHL